MARVTFILLGTFLVASQSTAQTTNPVAMDSLLQRLVGTWTMTGAVQGQAATYHLEVRRVLQNRFVELHMEDIARPPQYEARVFIGIDSAASRYVAHWMDNFGAAYSIPHGVGAAHGDTIVLTFSYANGPFRDTFSYDHARDAWRFRLESGDSLGHWRPFADYQVRRRR